VSDNQAAVGPAYKGVRTRVTELVASTDPARMDEQSPATPEWRVRDVLAHMVGVPADVLAGKLDGVATNAWTQAQVDARRDKSVREMLDEWEETGPQFEAALADVPFEITGQALFDAVTHEHDIRAALGAPGGRDSEAVGLAWQWLLGARAAGPRVCFVTEAGEELSGAGDVQITIKAPRFELVRAVTGRRTAEEVARYGWDPEPRVEMILGGDLFTMRASSLGE
jgi:uncharacterized protein (TIGR03083 family)